jgi:hypothetical protein
MSRPEIEPGPPRWEASTLAISYPVFEQRINSYSEHLHMTRQKNFLIINMCKSVGLMVNDLFVCAQARGETGGGEAEQRATQPGPGPPQQAQLDTCCTVRIFIFTVLVYPQPDALYTMSRYGMQS